MSAWIRRARAPFAKLALAGALAGLFAGALAVPASAAEYTAVLQITKIASTTSLAPGDALTYTIAVDCLTDDCVGARVVDELPEEFDELTLNPAVVVTGGPSSYSWGGRNNRTLTVDFTEDTPGGPGIPSGEGYSVQLSLTVPAGISPDWESNGVPVENTATVSAETAAPASASATATVTVPFQVQTSAGASWSPSATQFKIGEESELTVTTRNTSNARAASLSVLVPTDPTSASNLFERVDFAGFGDVVFPQGADRIQVDAYVGGSWVDGTPAEAAALPDGVVAADVTGLRIAFTSTAGTALTAGGTAGSVEVRLAQRATVRSSGVSLLTGATVTADVRGTVAVPGHGTANANATAGYAVGGLNSVVTGSFAFESPRIPAGTSSTATITGRNGSNGPLTTLALTVPADAGLFADGVTWAGFVPSGSAWPSGATRATLTWFAEDGPVPLPQVIDSIEELPTLPPITDGRITGFRLVFEGAIAAGATAAAGFRFDVDEDAVPESPGVREVVMPVRIDGHNDAGDADPATPSASLTMLYPQVEVALTKSITPGLAVPAGGRSVVQLRAQTGSDSGYVSPTSIVITDVRDAGRPDDYWNAFDVTAVAPTEIPAGATLTVRTTTDGGTWTFFDAETAEQAAVMYQAAIPGGASIVGIRFEFTDPEGFAQATTVQANLSFTARSTLRGTGGATAAAGAEAVYANTAVVVATGAVELPGGGPVTDEGATTATASVKSLDPGEGGAGGSGLMLSKSWVPVSGSTTVATQSGQTRTARILWGTEVSGHERAVVTDPADPTAPVAQTVFQAFDLRRIEAITTATDPLIAYDRVADVELYIGGSWVSVHATACAAAADCQGAFAGYTLTTTQRNTATGVRITFAEYEAGRMSDPLAPPVGSGVASGPDTRRIDLTFQIRNSLRDPSGAEAPWVTAGRTFNTGEAGQLMNTAALRLGPAAGGGFTGTSSSTITLLDPTPNLTATKAAQNSAGVAIAGPIAIPVPGDVALGDYPVVRFRLTATNSSLARAWYLRITDQMPCPVSSITDCVHLSTEDAGGWTVNPYDGKTWDPATSPFEVLDIENIDYSLSSNSGIGAAQSSVVLWHEDGSTSTVALAQAAAMTADDLADVVGVSALFGSTSTADGGTIASGATATLVIDTRLRQTLRSDPGTLVGPATITNSSFAQVWDGVLDDTNAYTSKSASITLVDATLAVAAGKTLSTSSLLESHRSDDVTVTLTANQSTSTASPREVVVADDTAEFWDAFDLRALGAVSMPSGADRLRVDAKVDGAWVHGAESSGAVQLPAGVAAGDVTGLRVVFWRSDGGLFSVTAPAASWNASVAFTVRLRDAYRDSGDPVEFTAPVLTTVGNTATATAGHDVLGVKQATASATFTLDPGTFRVDVEKRTSVKTTPAGETVAFELVVTNTGTGYLDDPMIVDHLPVDASLLAGGPLLFDPTSEVGYATTPGGMLSTTEVALDYDDAARTLAFTWPDGSRMAPGETFTITVPLQVAPGLPASYGDVRNEFTFSSSRALAACTNTSGNGEGVAQVGANGCRTGNDVRTISASAISSFKGVKGDVDEDGASWRGAVNVNNPSAVCVSDPEGFFRNPCAAHTVIGGEDLWKLRFTNGGNVAATGATVVDVLPRPGDAYLGTGAGRGSTFRPVFAGDVRLHTDALSAGTTMAWQVTTTTNPCPAFMSDPTCATATWVDGAGFDPAGYPAVTAIRVQFEFPDGELAPAADLAVTYRTVNLPSTSAGDERVPLTVPLGTPRAWNSFGVHATFAGGFTDRRVEPVRAGVQVASGPIEIEKEMTGPAAAYAPASVDAEVVCGILGESVAMPSGGDVVLAASGAVPYTTRIEGVPLGAECVAMESTGGASRVTYSNPTGPGAGILVTEPVGATDPVPSLQRAVITNEYGLTSLVIAKAVSTTATVGSFGPFAFALACEVDTGDGVLEVPLGPEDVAFTLADGESKTVDGIPVTATCELRETDADDADRIRVEVAGGATTTVAEGEAATIPLGTAESYRVDVENVYDGGRVAVSKTVAGDGKDEFGDGPFRVEVVCTYDGQTLAEEEFAIVDGQTITLDDVFPAGTECAIRETDAGGATVAAADGSVVVPGPASGQEAGLVTAALTNRFLTGSVRIVKETTGAAERYGDGPFQAQLVCTWDAPGDPGQVIPLPDGGLVDLTAGNGYTATVTGLIAGADCTVTETKTGGATSSDAGEVPAVVADDTVEVTIVNDFATGSLRIEKVREGEGAGEFGDGPFEVGVECGYVADGAWRDIDLGVEAVRTLGSANGYQVVIGDLLAGAECEVVETDRGHAVASASDPADGVVVIPEGGEATVTVTNTFLIGALDIEKTASEAIVQGGQSFRYTITVANVDDVDAGGVRVVDEIDPDLEVTGAAGEGWTCALDGEDADGYGGTLACDLDGVLGVGATAAGILVDVAVRPEVAKDELRNEAVVSSATAVVRGDRDEVVLPVKWLDVAAVPECVMDAPWLEYSVTAHNLGVAGETLVVAWLDASGGVVHEDEIAITEEGVVTGRLLWPGAAVDADGRGIAWPGWRPALPGETPEWENLVLDPAAFGYGLRSGASVRFSINPGTTVAIDYPPPSPDCAETPEGRDSDLWMTKTASATRLAAGERFEYVLEVGNEGLGAVTRLVLVDDLPAELRVLEVRADDPPGPDDPAWGSCETGGQDARGYGGWISCELDRELGHGQTAPRIVLSVQLDPVAPAGPVVNTARVTAYELPVGGLAGRSQDDLGDLETLALEDSALVTSTGRLASTGGPVPAAGAGIALGLLVAGGAILGIVVPRRRETA